MVTYSNNDFFWSLQHKFECTAIRQMVQKESIKSTILTKISVTSRTITKTRSIIENNSLLAFSATYHRICVNQFLESMQHAKVLSPLEYSYAYRLMSVGLYYMCGKCLMNPFQSAH